MEVPRRKNWNQMKLFAKKIQYKIWSGIQKARIKTVSKNKLIRQFTVMDRVLVKQTIGQEGLSGIHHDLD